MDFINLATRFLEIKSVSEEGNEEAINFLIPLFEQAGAKLVLQQVPHSLREHSKRQFNLLAMFGDDLVDSRTKRGLLFLAPVDTAAAGNPADWNELGGQPFKPKIEKDCIVGVGAANSKLNFLAMLAAASHLAKAKFQQPLYLAATCGGESVLAGTKYLIQSGAVNPKYVLVGRPTSLRLQNSEKTTLSFQIKISFVAVERDAQEYNAKVFVSSKSRGAHVDHPDSTKNALENVLFFLEHLRGSTISSRLMSIQGASSLFRVPDMASVGVVIRSKDLDAIRDRFRSVSANHRSCQFEMRLGGTGDRGVRLLPEEIYQALQMIRAEISDLNQAMGPVRDEAHLPDCSRAIFRSIQQERDYLEISVHFSLLGDLASQEAKAEIERDFKERISKVGAKFQKISIETRKVFGSQAYTTSPDSTYVTILKADMARSGLLAEHRPGNTFTEAAAFTEKGFDSISFGAGESPMLANCPNEKVKVDDLHAAVRFYTRVIDALCVRGI
jgi:acetylornithine deacetylase/succinyl-diaminopimelate desuccinylase-like protein